MQHTALDVWRQVTIFFSIGVAITCLEYFASFGEFRDGGACSWNVMRTMVTRRPRASTVGRLMDRLFDATGVAVLLSLRIGSVVALCVFGPIHPASVVAVVVLLASHLAFSFRQILGEDGSDQMNSVIAVSLALCLGPISTPVARDLGLWFITAQACLAYFSAGVAKLISPIWRNGSAVQRIFDTGSYGMRSVGGALAGRREIGLMLCWGVMVFEVLFPLVLVVPVPYRYVILGTGVVFHLLNAIIMGLNNFFWSFTATYPAVLYVASRITEGS